MIKVQTHKYAKLKLSYNLSLYKIEIRFLSKKTNTTIFALFPVRFIDEMYDYSVIYEILSMCVDLEIYG